jgi:hypothetical protein
LACWKSSYIGHTTDAAVFKTVILMGAIACFNTISLLLLLRDLFFSAASGVVVSVFLFLPL